MTIIHGLHLHEVGLTTEGIIKIMALQPFLSVLCSNFNKSTECEKLHKYTFHCLQSAWAKQAEHITSVQSRFQEGTRGKTKTKSDKIFYAKKKYLLRYDPHNATDTE